MRGLIIKPSVYSNRFILTVNLHCCFKSVIILSKLIKRQLRLSSLIYWFLEYLLQDFAGCEDTLQCVITIIGKYSEESG